MAVSKDEVKDEMKQTPVLTPTKKFLTADEIFAADDRDFADVEVPEWKGWIRLRSLSAEEALKFMEQLQDPKTKNQGMVRIIQLCATDESGKLLFAGVDSLQKLRLKNVKVFKKLQDEAMRLIGFADETPLEIVCEHEGCGFKTTDLAQAKQHAETRQHSLNVTGRIVSDKERRQAADDARKNDSGGAATGASASAWQ